MKKLALLIGFTCSAVICFGQTHLLSYDDLKFLLTNNLQKTDTFMMAKGYLSVGKKNNTNNRSYSSITGSNHVLVDIRLDGKKLFVELQTNEIEQYDLIHSSISQYVTKDSVAADVQTYDIKGLGTIYIQASDTVPYDPLKREYDMHIVSDKHLTAYN